MIVHVINKYQCWKLVSLYFFIAMELLTNVISFLIFFFVVEYIIQTIYHLPNAF